MPNLTRAARGVLTQAGSGTPCLNMVRDRGRSPHSPRLRMGPGAESQACGNT